jgi:hypothetical protein
MPNGFRTTEVQVLAEAVFENPTGERRIRVTAAGKAERLLLGIINRALSVRHGSTTDWML